MKLMNRFLLAVVLTCFTFSMSFAYDNKSKTYLKKHAKTVKESKKEVVVQKQTKDSAQQRLFGIKCCVKFVIGGFKFKRPKKNCQSGFGLCITTSYACILCHRSSNPPDCSKCSPLRSGDIEITGTIDEDAGTVTLVIPNEVKTYFDGEDDFSNFGLDEDFKIFDAESSALKATLPMGEYSVTDDGENMTITIQAVIN